MVRLNKNQTKFFEEAIKHFGEGSSDVRYKDLTDFAEKNDLIVPVSALKLFCQGSVRGHYNLLLSGVVESASPSKNSSPMNFVDDDSGGSEGVIISSSIFGSGGSSSKVVEPRLPKCFYVVLDNELIPVSVHKSINGAHQKCSNILKDKGVSPLEQAQKDMRANKCHCVISEYSPDQCFIHEVVLEN